MQTSKPAVPSLFDTRCIFVEDSLSMEFFIITSAALQIIRHQIPEVGDSCSKPKPRAIKKGFWVANQSQDVT